MSSQDTPQLRQDNVEDNFSPTSRDRAMKNAIFSACWGAVSQVMVSDSSVIILYAGLLGASRFVSLCTTSLQLLSLCILYIPAAYWMSRNGRKKPVVFCTIFGGIALWSILLAPYVGKLSSIWLLAGLGIFSICMSLYTIGWFPMLRDVLPEKKRGSFFGKLRVSWQSVSVVFLTLSALIVKKWDNNILTFQFIIFVVAGGLFARAWYLSKIPAKPLEKRKNSLIDSLIDVLSCSPLMGFGTYLFWLYMFAGATIPVSIVMCKLHLGISGSFLIILSSCYMVGCICGFYIGGKIVDRRGTRPVFLMAHFSFSILNLMFLMVQHDSPVTRGLLIFISVFYGMMLATASIAVSSKAFAVVPSEYPDLGLAVCLGLYYAGFGLSRFLAGWILDSGMLSPTWNFFGLEITQYHTLFLIYAAGVLATSVLLVMIPAIIVKRKIIPYLR